MILPVSTAFALMATSIATTLAAFTASLTFVGRPAIVEIGELFSRVFVVVHSKEF